MTKKRRVPLEKKKIAVKYEVKEGWLRVSFLVGNRKMAMFTFDNPEGFLNLFGDLFEAAAEAWPDHWLMKEYHDFEPPRTRTFH